MGARQADESDDLIKLFPFYLGVCVCICVCARWHERESVCSQTHSGQRIIALWSGISPSAYKWVPGIELRLPCLGTNAISHWAWLR